MSVKIIGQQLIDCGDWFNFGQGIGCAWPENPAGLELWSGIGPHSSGGHTKPICMGEQDCLTCGASWFLPFLKMLKSGEFVSVGELERAHFCAFGRPMLTMIDQAQILEQFKEHVKNCAKPSSFFPACRIVRWNGAKNTWDEIFSTNI